MCFVKWKGVRLEGIEERKRRELPSVFYTRKFKFGNWRRAERVDPRCAA